MEYSEWLEAYKKDTRYYKLRTDLQQAQFDLELYKYDSDQRLACICGHLGIKLIKSDGYRVVKI